MTSPTLYGSLAERARAGHSPGLAMPSAPRPSADQGIKPPAQAPPDESDAIPSDPSQLDIFHLSPLAALRLLTKTVEDLLHQHIAAEAAAAALPTPPNSLVLTPQTSSGSHEGGAGNTGTSHTGGEDSPPSVGSPKAHHHEDIPRSHKTPIGSPETHPTEPVATVAGTGDSNLPGLDLADAQGKAAAHAARAQERRMLRRFLARKFYSKAVPPIPLSDYLRRLHTYCPMSAAVYLTAAIYLERLVQLHGVRHKRRNRRRSGRDVFEDEDDCSPPISPVSEGNRRTHKGGRGRHHSESPYNSDDESATRSDDDSDSDSDSEDPDAEPILPLTPRTAHRLLLGALRVATKALEDLSYSHTRFAKVGGVSDKELTRLEVNFLFLVRFRLVIGPQRLQRGAIRMTERWLAEDEE